MKKLELFKRPIRGTRLLNGTFYCVWCGQSFENKPARDSHEAICKTFGFSQTPRPHVLEATNKKP